VTPQCLAVHSLFRNTLKKVTQWIIPAGLGAGVWSWGAAPRSSTKVVGGGPQTTPSAPFAHPMVSIPWREIGFGGGGGGGCPPAAGMVYLGPAANLLLPDASDGQPQYACHIKGTDTPTPAVDTGGGEGLVDFGRLLLIIYLFRGVKNALMSLRKFSKKSGVIFLDNILHC